MNSNHPHFFRSASEAAEACSRLILDLLREAVESRGRATLAVSGGSTPKLLFEYMRQADFPWSQLQFFFVDERAVPPDNEQSNFRLAHDHFFAPLAFPLANIHSVDGTDIPKRAAERYSHQIQDAFALRDGELPEFDVVQHGMGPDGHTASLFPGDPLIADRTGIAAAVVSPDKAPRDRITLLPGVLLASRATVFLLDGEDKRSALQSVLTAPYDPVRFPSQLLARSGKPVDWFIGGIPDFPWPAG